MRWRWVRALREVIWWIFVVILAIGDGFGDGGEDWRIGGGM